MLVIREMCRDDLQTVAAIEASIFSRPWSKEGFASSLVKEYTLYLTAQLDGRIAGYCGMLQTLDEAEITNVAVREECRRHGIAAQMLEELISRGRDRGVCTFFLEVRAGNAAARRLYEKLGFTAAGTRRRFYESPTEDAVVMRLDLQGSPPGLE